MNRIITQGFGNEQLIVTKGFGRWKRKGGVSAIRRRPEILLPAHRELRFDIKAPVELEMQTNFQVINSVSKNVKFSYPLFSPLLKVNNFFFDLDLSVLINKQLSLPIEQRLNYNKLIRMLKAI